MEDTCPPLKHLMIAVPEYDGKPFASCVQGIIGAVMDCLSHGVMVQTLQNANCCYLDLVRNDIVRQFLDSEADRLMLIDADVGFPGEAVHQVASTLRPVVGGVYPKKSDKPEWPVFFPGHNIYQDPETGLLEAAALPTGFLCIHRQVFEAMQPHVPVFEDDRRIQMHAYFQTSISEGKFWGEDIHFCRQWRALGGKIWLHPDIHFTHMGTRAWEGNYHEWFAARPSWDKIEGFNNCPHLFAEAVERASHGAHFVEVGAWVGRSTAFMAELIRTSRKEIIFDVVDHWEGSEELTLDTSKGTQLEQFTQNVAYVRDHIKTVHAGKSVDIASLYADASLDFVFLDGAHDTASVRADCAAWWPKVKPGGILAGDDWPWESVQTGVQLYFESIPGQFTLMTIDEGWRIVKPED